ncbi:MAG: hypothetical protein ACK5LY_08055 [Lachnospirales bacterium]
MKNLNCNSNLKDTVSKLPNDVKNDMNIFLETIKNKSPEEKIDAMLKYKKNFEKFNINKKVKDDIGKEVENSLSNEEKQIINKHLK